MRLVVVSFVGLLAACSPSPEQEVHDVCTAACNCTETLPSRVDTCVAGCVADMPSVSDECVECIYTYSQSCTDLFAQCDDPCTQPQPKLPLGGMQ
jgi:hypothetical protein